MSEESQSELIYSISRSGRRAYAQAPRPVASSDRLPRHLCRQKPPRLPEVSELETVRHFTRLSQKNFSIDTHFYPLGSCTMKYNPRGANKLAMLPQFIERHPLAPDSTGQGFLACLYELQNELAVVTGMQDVSLSIMAGAQGEFAGVAMIRAYHMARGDEQRTEIIVPDAAHGTNPATATMCGYKVREIPTGADGDVDMEALRAALGPQTAGIMLTNPSTVGVFESRITEIATLVHEAGGLLYYDGANLNAILGKARPGDMGFDVIHLNLHKTFSTPHGGGGPGAGAVGVNERLLPYLPIPRATRDGDQYRWLDENDCPDTIGRLGTYNGNSGILLRAYVYMRMLGREGMVRVAEYSTLNANYLMMRLREAGFTVAYPERRASHEFIVSLKNEAKEFGVNAMDFAKRLLDLGYHAPTTYFPLLVPEALLIEPTETESKGEMDGFVAAMERIREEARDNPELVKGAPYCLPVRRLDDVKAARELDLRWEEHS
ncbi:aminomethyl-transferring glycine dehydrogenase subunit GcvPB [Halorhodospira halochloris]|uniref:Probable glycine dehydrogenase (decarboxylating) subunit 2 n=1 Tax=Halorhodospira halochloris TaxID=1052 RepID=A0A0X8X800_HALHR|nr:aminomethyl-transferring glycine dehydrogenase subunit GcvPB [Halorhodospira halochloris]MBK1650800.1 glycine dehydrogenase (aminomethyl-transferring) [Halorhodospira halochloris]MCG5530239.1 aminomethyl-transferring glycine dehydrogenase subunit GcvPB [Halorhodospira halochloris]MCG5547153.1 aminomethyl-transferring glycine dehydrogenase subunit GcvPB [Halorhodospira halochloris]BAU56702.1 glycine dehydrogenase [Halorhodospira halochloris]